MTIPNCFLCEPDAELLVKTTGPLHIMVGLGPISPTYAMIASCAHLPSLADLACTDPSAIDQILRARREIEFARGPLVMTEHGRVPVCRDHDEHEPHCFHGHALLFSVDGKAFDLARDYYVKHLEFDALGSALAYAAQQEAYLLVSRSPTSFEVLSGPLNTPRQLARTLAAISAEQFLAADWRSNPRKSEAVELAFSLRTAIARPI